ncbi:arylsulfatase A-like enzyme [Polaribacter sp. Hel1_33_96]|jgi:arylsulfatase A-like enzyme|uniref:sulfatase-like hydrolase/transferase n=1 Tax=Polaribacter sp. Hel1_33_96 TaxID=1336805 RepID=UPI000C708137|nr:sulfatase-like hydrolase/transferase [Polaribacter sp. Hel1_33_96]PKV65259.1 arylsulfatase A-like enzyme [Polaribacter sp. Hel1_33_96]
MKNKIILLIVGFLLLMFNCKSKNELVNQTETKKKPNVLLLFSDQHNKKVMGFENHPDAITPNLDKLAGESAVFDRAYATRGICVPSRMSLMTGLYPRTMGLMDNKEKTTITRDAVSLASIFKFNDYNTYSFGKRHLVGGGDKGWDVKKEVHAEEGDNGNYLSWITKQGYQSEFSYDWAAEFGKGPKGSNDASAKIPIADLGTRISKLPFGYTMEAYTASETIKMIKKQKNSDKPFFCFSSFYRPHQPYTPLKKFRDLYNVSEWGEGTKLKSGIKIPASFYQPTKDLPPLLQFQRNGGNKVWNMDKAFKDEQIWRDFIGGYYALVTEVDHYVGEILEALDKANMKEETIIIYTTDHGDFVGNHGMVEKAAAGHNVYEDILNIPLIIRIPEKTTNGKHTAELVTLVDIIPTLVDVLDLKVPVLKHNFEGRSLAKLLIENKPLNRDYIVSESWFQATVIGKDSKLGIMLENKVKPRQDYREYGDMYFDRNTDPLEIKNGIKEEKNQASILKLRNYYEEFNKKIPGIGKQETVQNKTKK